MNGLVEGLDEVFETLKSTGLCSHDKNIVRGVSCNAADPCHNRGNTGRNGPEVSASGTGIVVGHQHVENLVGLCIPNRIDPDFVRLARKRINKRLVDHLVQSWGVLNQIIARRRERLALWVDALNFREFDDSKFNRLGELDTAYAQRNRYVRNFRRGNHVDRGNLSFTDQSDKFFKSDPVRGN